MSFTGSPNNPGSGGGAGGGVLFGTAAARPPAAAGNNGFGYFATDTGEVTFSDGATWHAIAGTSVTSWKIAIGGGGNFPVLTYVNGTNTELGNQNASNAIATSNSDVLIPGGNLDVQTAGKGLKVAEGANAKQGTATLVAGTVTVANTSVTATSRIMFSPQETGVLTGILRVSARVVGTSFTLLSSVNTDTAVIAWEIFEVG